MFFQHFGYAVHAFFVSNTRLKLAKKNQAKAKQHPETEFLLLKNYYLLSSSLSFAFFWFTKIIGPILKKFAKNKCVYFNEIIWLIMIKVKKKNRSHRYVINRSKSRHGPSVWWCLQALSNTQPILEAWFTKKLRNTEAELKRKCCL